MDNRPIGIFDSGVGGLTVARSIIDLLPNENVIYLGDSARGPFGPKLLDDVRDYTFEIISFLQDEGVKLVVIACNTAASAALEPARAHFAGLPLMGVVEPGIHAGLAATRTGRIGLIGTVGTVEAGAYDAALAVTRRSAFLFKAACPAFVDYVERGETEGDKVEALARTYLEPLMSEDIDTLILGCTHYPLLAKTIKKVVGESVTLVDSADSTAFEVADLLASVGQRRMAAEPAWHRFVSSGDPRAFAALGERFLGPEVKGVEKITWPSLFSGDQVAEVEAEAEAVSGS